MKNQRQRQKSDYGVIHLLAPNTFFNNTNDFVARLDIRGEGEWIGIGTTKTAAKKQLLSKIAHHGVS